MTEINQFNNRHENTYSFFNTYNNLCERRKNMGFGYHKTITMKYFIKLIFLFSVGLINAQSYTEKYNSLEHRYEYFNSDGNLAGYKYYDGLNQQWVYKDMNEQPKSTYINPINEERVSQVLAAKDRKYDVNVDKIRNAINTIREKVYNLNLNIETKNSIWSDFNSRCLNVIDKKNYDYSNNNTPRVVINFMYESIDKIISNNIQPTENNYRPDPYKEYSGFVELKSSAPFLQYPSENSPVKGQIPKGKVQILSRFNALYYEINYNGTTGYIFSAYFKN